MRFWNQVGLPAASVVLALSGFGFAGTGTEADLDALRARIAELEARIERLQAATGADRLTQQRAQEIRSLVQDVLADADTRANLLQDGMTAGYDGGFFIASTDGNFLLKINSQIPARFVYNNQNNSPVDDNRSGFEMRRTKLKFKDHVVEPSWQYAINTAFDRSSGMLGLEDAFIRKDFDNGWSVRLGQYKPPFMREELVSSSRQLAVERSLMNEEFNQDRTKGVEFQYTGDSLRVLAMYHEGFETRNTAWSAENTEFAFTARGEWLARGAWKQFKDLTSWHGERSGTFTLACPRHATASQNDARTDRAAAAMINPLHAPRRCPECR